MSYVHLFIIKDDCIYLVNTHYRSAMNLLDNAERLIPLLKSRFLDSGYVVLDLNRKVIVNGQSAFPVKSKLCVVET